MKFYRSLRETYKRMNTAGTWISISDAACFVGTIIFIISLVFFTTLYYITISTLNFDLFVSFGRMPSTQLVLFILFFLFTIFSTFVFTTLFIKLYDMLINTPVNQLLAKMKNLNAGNQLDYLMSGKISNPLKNSNGDETWMDLVQNYLDVSSAEKYIDELTGCFNRKYYSQFLVHFMATQMLSYPNPNMPKTYDTDTYAVFQLDIDHFKRINDDYGHDAGDKVLKEVGLRLREYIGDNGIVIRNGGEEFVVVVSRKFPFEFSSIAEEINQLFRDNIVAYGTSTKESRKVTCSIGFISYPIYGDKTIELSFQDHVTLADMALYKSKEDSRDMWYEVVPKYKPKANDLHMLLEFPEKAVEEGYIEFKSSKSAHPTRAKN